MLEMLREIIHRVRESVTQEREDRERTEETFVNLLEATCNKLNAASNEI